MPHTRTCIDDRRLGSPDLCVSIKDRRSPTGSDRFRWIAVLTIGLLTGCNSQKSGGPDDHRFVWDREQRPYEVVAIGGSNVPRLGDQTRTVQAVYHDPEAPESVTRAVEEIYAELKQDVEEVQPDAKYRHVTVTIYEVEGDVKHDSAAWLASLIVSPEDGEPLPDDVSEKIRLQWRDPPGKPTDEEREIEWQYLDAIQQANNSVEVPISDAATLGMTAAQRRAHMEKAYPEKLAEARKQIADSHRLTRDELDSLLNRILDWKYAGEVAEPRLESEADASGKSGDQAEAVSESPDR